MYEAIFQLSRRPFSAPPDSSCLFPAAQTTAAIQTLAQQLTLGEGISLLISPAGLGKSLVCKVLSGQLADRFNVACIGSSHFPTRRALLQNILYEFGLPYAGLGEQELRLQLLTGLKAMLATGSPAVVLLDEAHILSDRLLDELRGLADTTVDNQPVLRLLLAAQPDLEERLTQPGMQALNLRLNSHVYLDPLSMEESIDYIEYRLRWAGSDGRQVFSLDALRTIAQVCDGVPRCVNQLCDHAMLLAYVAESPVVTRETVNDALNDLRQLPLHWSEPIPIGAEPGNPTTASLEPSPSTIPQAESSLWTDAPTANPGGLHQGGLRPGGLDDKDEDELLELSELPELFEPELPAESNLNSEGEPTASFEIGAEPASTPVVVDIRSMRLQGVAPVAHGYRSSVFPTGFEEEPVIDAYALLDNGNRRFGGYGDASRLLSISLPEQPHPIAEPKPVVETRPVAEVVITGGVLATVEITAAAPFGGESMSQTVVPAETRLFSEVSPAQELERSIAGELMAICVDLQQAITAATTQKAATLAPSISMDEAKKASEEYDVIEPVSESRSSTPRIRIDGQNGDEPVVPQPNYKRIFSLLRRKQGKTYR